MMKYVESLQIDEFKETDIVFGNIRYTTTLSTFEKSLKNIYNYQISKI